MPRGRLPRRRMLRVLLALKAVLGAMLVTGALFPHVGGFEGKGMAFRLPIFMAPALIVPVRWWRGHDWNAPLDAAFTVPFLLDTAGNAFGFYDSFDATDDVLHALNWIVLIWGVTAALYARHSGERALAWIAGTGIGALAIIGWEIAEYAAMKAGTVGLNLTYGDTLGDLALSSTGGAIGALIAVRWWPGNRQAVPSITR